jgi:hypothetical protein
MTKENCLSCGAETPYDFDTNIKYRANYIEGVGQLCRTCFNEGSTPKSHILIPINLIKDTPNDMELGKKIRHIYHQKF